MVSFVAPTLRKRTRPSGFRNFAGSLSFVSLITHALCLIVGFYFGLLLEVGVEDRISQEVERRLHGRQVAGVDATRASGDGYPKSLHDVFVGMASIDRDSLTATLDPGVPWDPSNKNNNEALVLFQSEKALPPEYAADITSSATPIPKIPINTALRDCNSAHLILTQPSNRQQCLIIANQYEAYHIQKFMRLPASGGISKDLPLRLVNRAATEKGRKSNQLPSLSQTQTYWNGQLQSYLANFTATIDQIRPLAAKTAHPTSQTIIVMVCNWGHVELVLNWLCGARARGLTASLRHVLVWATDVKTRDTLSAAGIAVVYLGDDNGMPERAAGRYADATFGKMMLAKVWCVQQLVWLGYNVLFQDADVMWYKDPLEYWVAAAAATEGEYDMYFQDDGNHSPFYAPYSANTGFYYVRANDATRNLFNTLLLTGDLIVASKSHQVPLVALLAEHASLYGLRVHIWNRWTNDFPGGHAFHRRKDFMKDMVKGQQVPFILHMSWTSNKNNKIKFFQQLGEWYVDPHKCNDSNWNADACCLAEPYFECHYRDKPSKSSCKSSPPIDKGRPSFW